MGVGFILLFAQKKEYLFDQCISHILKLDFSLDKHGQGTHTRKNSKNIEKKTHTTIIISAVIKVNLYVCKGKKEILQHFFNKTFSVM